MQIANKKLITLLTTKDELVADGRKISKEIEKIEEKIKDCEDKERVLTAKVEPKELGEQAEALKKEINEKIKAFEAIAEKIKDEKMKAIPEVLEKKHLNLLKEKEEKERERNKIALKVQKIKDRAVPIIQKEVKPHLKEFEDIETAVVKKGFVEVKTYSRLEEWKAGFRKRAT